MLRCRPVQDDDIPKICGFPQDAEELFFMFPKASYPLTTVQLQTAIAERADSTVVEVDGQVVGFANFYRWETGGVCSIGNVIIAPSFRANGVGRFLIHYMMELAFTQHVASEVNISCFNRNVAGLLLYTRLGFVPVSINEDHDKQGNRVALINLRILRSTHHLA